MIYRHIKPFFDFLLATCGLVILLPVFIITSIAIKIDSQGPVFFRQQRVGLNGRPFSIFKFRTMTTQPTGEGMQITTRDDPRITPLGSFLRKYKIDELPQLFNVVRGEMSLVGPRPEVPKYIERYSDDDRGCVLSVKPGITDLASIHFKDEEVLLKESSDPESTYANQIVPQKIAFYRRYVDSLSFRQDILIIAQTIASIIHNRQK